MLEETLYVEVPHLGEFSYGLSNHLTLVKLYFFEAFKDVPKNLRSPCLECVTDLYPVWLKWEWSLGEVTPS